MEGKNAQQKAEFMIHLRNIVFEHLSEEDFDVKAFAGIVGISRSELYRRIKKQTGQSVSQFIRDIRLDEGMRLLEETDMTAAEISFKVGFNSPAYFNKCFKDRFGITPGEADAGKEPVFKSLHQGYHTPRNPSESIWNRRNLTVFFIVIILGGFGYWYYLISQNPYTEKPEERTPPSQNNAPGKGGSSIAVLPLENWTGDDTNQYICLGITDAIISELRQTALFERIKPLADVYSIKDSLSDSKALMQKLGVDHILQGYLQKAGNQLKISLKFIKLHNYEILWSESFILGWSEKETFRIQQRIADEVMHALGENIQDNKTLSDTLFTGTLSPKAFDLVMKGRYQTYKFTKEEWERSLKFYEEAIQEDPQYAFAYSSLGYAWLWSGAVWSFAPQDMAWQNAKRFFTKALEVDDDHEGALRGLKIGNIMYELNMNPRIARFPQLETYTLENTHHDYALKMGLFSKSENSLEKTIRETPSASYTHALLALTYFLSGKETQARKLLDETYALFDDDAQYLMEAAKMYYLLGEKEKMHTAITTFYNKFDERSPIILWLRTLAHDHKNEIKERDRLLDTLEARYKERTAGSPAWFLALYNAHHENYELALDWLERSYQAREVEMTWLAQEPTLAPLGSSSRYQALLDSMNFPHSARRHVKSPDEISLGGGE